MTASVDTPPSSMPATRLRGVDHYFVGRGNRAATGAGYQFPPVAGPDSFNNGAGMSRILAAAAFVRHNMPLGTMLDAPVLSDADAYDVAAYIENLDPVLTTPSKSTTRLRRFA